MLRQQLIVAERKIQGRVRWTPWQRFVMGLAAQLTPAWQTVAFLVQPAAVATAELLSSLAAEAAEEDDASTP